MRTTLSSCIASLAALAAAPANAETYHVAATGDDGAAGTAAAPWRTPQRAASAVAAGDTVVIHAGTYGGFRVTARGTAAAPIVFTGDGDARIVGAAAGDRDAVILDGAAFVRIEGLAISDATRAGVAALDCHDITVRGNTVDHNGKWGVFSAFCDDLVVEDNEVSRSGTQHGVYASNSADRPVIRRNRIWGNAMCGVHLNGDINFGGDGVISGAIVEDNVILDNGRDGGSAINGDGITGAVIRNNVLDANHASGISVYRIDGGAPSTGNRIINNTIRMAGDARSAINIQDASTGNVVRNNVLLDPSPGRAAIDLCASCVTGFVSDHNAVVGRFLVGGQLLDLAAFRARTGTDAASFVATDGELFVDAAAGDLRLRAGAPAIDAGEAVDAPAAAIDGTARPQGAAIDIGAYEFCDGACAGGEGDGGGEGGEGDGGGGNGGAGGQTGGGSSGDVRTEPGAPGGDAISGGGCDAGGGAGWAWVVGIAGVALAARRRQRP